MNTDIRLNVGFWQHPKTKKTAKRLGLEGIRSLQMLWLWAAVNRPDGNLSGMDWEDIELAADWQGEERDFFDHCLTMWIDQTEDGYALHDWAEHNSWASEADDRSGQSRLAKLAQVNRAAFDDCISRGITGLTADEYREMKRFSVPKLRPIATAERPQSGPTATAERPLANSTGPAPAPSPNPEEEEKYIYPPVTSAEEVHHARALGSVQGGDGEGTNFPIQPTQEPHIDFLELRQHYDEQIREEGQMTGHREFCQLRAARSFPGIHALMDAIDAYAETYGKAGCLHAVPGLARFIGEGFWKKKPQARASPPGKQAPIDVVAQNAEISRRILEKRHGNQTA